MHAHPATDKPDKTPAPTVGCDARHRPDPGPGPGSLVSASGIQGGSLPNPDLWAARLSRQDPHPGAGPLSALRTIPGGQVFQFDRDLA